MTIPINDWHFLDEIAVGMMMEIKKKNQTGYVYLKKTDNYAHFDCVCLMTFINI